MVEKRYEEEYVDNLPSPGNNLISTDGIISKYEDKLNSSIANKTLNATKKGILPTFTDEEMAYLRKKAMDESPLSEVKVITPDPTITLKKGKTEINIKNAATLVRKMEEKYPTGTSKNFVDSNLNQETSNPPMVQRFNKLVNFDVNDVSSEIKKSVAPDLETFQQNKFGEHSKSVNKNAYEIRADILAMALDFVKYRTQLESDLDGCEALQLSNADDVIEIAQKFYKFVENKR